MVLVDALLILFCAATLIAVEYFVYRDLDSRGVEPWATMALIVLFTPIGLLVWWIKRRGAESPHGLTR